MNVRLTTSSWAFLAAGMTGLFSCDIGGIGIIGSRLPDGGAADVSETLVLSFIAIEPQDVTVEPGATHAFEVLAVDQYGDPIPTEITWESGNTDIGTIDSAGVFSAIAQGSVTVTASSGAFRTTASITVVAAFTCGENGCESDETCSSCPSDCGSCPAYGSTIAYFGDSEPGSSSDAEEITKDLDQVIPLSPTGKVDAIFFMGDMTKLSLTLQAVAASTVKDVPVYFVIGNHEAGSSSDTAVIQGRFSTSIFPLNPGPSGTDKTTYSMDVGNIHVVNMNEYWNGATDDSYLKYSSSDGGYVPDALFNWISTDLSQTSNWKIVVGHDPLYPKSRHVGNSLDADKTNRDKLQALFVSKTVDLFIGAHTHYAGVQNVGGVYHANTGVIGSGASGSGDGVASISYTHTTADSLILTIIQENPTWSTPKTVTTTAIGR